MTGLYSDEKIKRYIKGLFIGYVAVALFCCGLIGIRYFNIMPMSKTFQYNSMLVALVMPLIATFLIGYHIVAYIHEHLNRTSGHIARAMNNNFKEEDYIPVKYKEGALYSLDYQMAALVNKLYTNQDQFNEERKRLNSLVTEVAHQLKTPIAAIKLFYSLLHDSQISQEEKEGVMIKLSDEVDRIEWLTGTLSDLSKLETGLIQLHMQEQPIHHVILEAVNTVYLDAEAKGIEIILMDGDQPRCSFDKKWTKEAIVNILDNAIKYSTRNSKVTIQIEHNVMFNKICITDTGMGISQADMPFIFNRFYKGKHTGVHEGIGIGLYLAKEIMKNQNGTIKVYSELGVGTTFEILFFTV
ncbi:HAMP domain-containing histidine kinase [Vallitalea pronyensis]|uniref:histidine kinase n=1 Tax=Vallitalea pronyensis TaxID=1348613 RepID=A0A8J8SFL5_9FIRM|nr:HAMP domain-containing sensor histidine kinase [Vallitalea pronyensis]QUI21805.1 HAMP domain-containing histidine kinase [Vallitalea pronyensis]